MKKVLITGIDGFTGKYLSTYLKSCDYEVYGSSYVKTAKNVYKCDITDTKEVTQLLETVKPDYIIHLSGISFPAHGDNTAFYKVNTIGTTNILDALVKLKQSIQKIILVSSATVYGNLGKEVLDESLCPQPANHYGASKYAMESLARGYFDKLPIIIARPFNYTGLGQSDDFLIPKIVKHFIEKKKSIELGNIDVSREFNSVLFICEAYKKLLESQVSCEVVNIASNRGIKLLDVIDIMQEIAGYTIEVKINPNFVRKDEIKTLTGSSDKLFCLVGEVRQESLKETLESMMS